MANRKEKKGQMKRLQRKLIPLNVIVAVISVVAAVTLFFMPLLEIKLGNITGNPEVIKFVDDKISQALDSESGSAEGEAGDLLAEVDIPKIVVPVVEAVLSEVNGNISISTYSLLGLATSPDPGSVVSDMLLSEKDGLLKQLTDSLVQAVMDLPRNKEFTGAVEEVILVSMGNKVKENVPEDYKNLVDPQELAATLKQMDGVKSEEEAVAVIDGYLTRVEENNSQLGVMDETKKEEIKDMVGKVYQNTVEHTKDENGDNFSVEAMVCIAASEALGTEALDDIRNEDGSIDLMTLINKLIGGGSSEAEGAGLLKSAVAFDEAVPGGEENPGTETGGESGGTAGGDSGEGTEGGSEGGTETGGGTSEREVCTKYVDLFGTYVKIDEDEVRTEIKKLVDDNVGAYIEQAVAAINDMSSKFPVFWIVFGAFALFAAVWVVLFLFSFLRLFSRNKRFTMWYVKLFGAIPVILFWLAPLVAGWVIPAYFPTLLGEFQWALPVLLGALGTTTWISGICYVVLWLLSVFWAFPVKHKIRKLIKQRRG